MAVYNNLSPWYATKLNNEFLDLWNPRPIPASDDDFEYTIQPQYNYRPDLLAYDIYGNAKLWWVFTQRNIDILIDPIYDFRAGVTIKLPKQSFLLETLGVT